MVEAHLPHFEVSHGLVTTLVHSESHPEQAGKQWEWPNGWAPLHWIVLQGLTRYGFLKEAERIEKKWIGLVSHIFREERCFYEKYNVVDGARAVEDRYPDQVGFGWTNGVFLAMLMGVHHGTSFSSELV
jgi:alpha,alpha-trehalase